MAVVKLSKSGNQIQFIDDFGNVYGTSWQSIMNLKEHKVRQGFSMLMRLPFNVSTQRFGVSPVWNPGNAEILPLAGSNNSSIALKDDIMAYTTFKNKGKDVKIINDLEDW